MKTDRERLTEICKKDKVLQELDKHITEQFDKLDFNEYTDEDGEIYKKTNRTELKKIERFRELKDERIKFLVDYYQLKV